MRVLLLREEEVLSILTLKDVLDTVKEAFKQKGLGKTQMPPKSYLFFKKYNGDLRIMSSYIQPLGISGVKVVNVHPYNVTRFRMASIMATILLIDPKNGRLVSIMGGTYITALRTAAAAALAASYLSKKTSEVVGIIGTGVQARKELAALMLVRKIRYVKIFDKNKKNAVNYVKDMKNMLSIDVEAVNSIKEAVDNVDIVITATPSRRPLVMYDWIREGTHINAIGADAPGKEELDPNILKNSKIVIDDWHQASSSGEINVPLRKKILQEKDIYAQLEEIIIHKKKGRTNDKEITVFDSTGLAVQDVATAWLVFKIAKKKNIGTWIEF